MDKPFSQACDNNKEAIRRVLAPHIAGGGRLLEIGSGTGQHGAYISPRYPQLQWQTSDRPENHPGIQAWVADCQLANFIAPIELDVNTAQWTGARVDFVFSANTVHIMAWHEVEKLFALLPGCLRPGGLMMLYGPFNYGGRFTSDSNRQFDLWLKGEAPHRGIRDFEAVDALAAANGLTLLEDHTMPANNRLLIWQQA